MELVERDYCRPTSFEGRPFRVLETLLNENFPDLSADINRMLEEAGVDWPPYDYDRLED